MADYKEMKNYIDKFILNYELKENECFIIDIIMDKKIKYIICD